MKNPPSSKLNFFITFFTVLVVVTLDRISKLYFAQNFSLGESIPVIKNIFHFTLVHNTGIAFGLFKNQGIVFVIIPVIAIVLIIFHLYYSRNHQEGGVAYLVAFSLILGGAIGNLIDRIVFGHVIDFIDFRIWPVFNLADSAISIGAAIILLKCIPSFAK